MNMDKPSKPTKQEKAWQEIITKKTRVEKVKLDHPQGKQRFNQILKRTFKKDKANSQDPS